MADDVQIRLGLTGQAETSRGLRRVADDERQVGNRAAEAGAKAKAMGAAYATASRNISSGLTLVGRGARYGTAGLIGLTLAGTKWGLSFNAQVESARQRFQLFTNDVDGLTQSVKAIDAASQFNFGDLANAAALLGNQGVQNVPQVLQGIANAAAASGRGTQALNSIAIAIGQIQAKGRLSQEEINQITEAGGPGAQKAVQDAFGLTAKQVSNLGAQGLDANKAIDAITANWTSGRMADAAKRQLTTLGGQWDLFTGNLQKLSGAATAGLARGLETNVIPAANRAVDQITRVFGQDGLTNEEKLRRARAIINRELGPVWHDLMRALDRADLPEHLGELVGAAAPKMAAAAGKAGPSAAKAFVDAWLNSGPWGQLLSALFIGSKLGLGSAASELLKGRGRGGGGLGRVASKAQPVPVWVVNGPWGSKAPSFTSRVKDVAKTVGPAVAARAVPIGAGVTGSVAFGGIAALALTHNEDFPTRGPGASSPSNPAGHIPFDPGAPTRRVTVDVYPQSINIDGRTVGKVTARAQERQQARGR